MSSHLSLQFFAKTTMLVPTVLGSVTAVFAWMLQYLNGGVLNALVRPDSSNSASPSFELQADSSMIMNTLANLLLGKMKKENLAVLMALPAELGGGGKGVQEALKNPNRESTLIAASLAVLILAVLSLVILFILTCICCFCCSSRRRRKSMVVDDDSSSEITHTSSTLSDSDYSKQSIQISKEDQNIFCCCLHVLVIVFTALCLVGLIVCLGYYFGAANTLSEVLVESETNSEDVTQWLQGKTSSFSLGGLLKFGTSEIIKFGQAVLIDIFFFQTTLPAELHEFLEKLIVAFKVKAVQQAVGRLESDISGISNASEYIKKHRDPVVEVVSSNADQLNMALENIKNNCISQSTQADALRTNFEEDKVASIPEGLNNALAETSKKLNSIVTQLNDVITKVESLDENILEKIKETLDIQTMLESLDGLWDQLNDLTNSVDQQLNGVMTTVSNSLGKFSSVFKGLLFALAVPFLLAAILFILFLVVFICEAIYRHLFSLTGTSASEVAAGDPWIARSCVCGGGKFCCCSCLLLLPVLLLGLFACLAITLNGFVGVEFCPYITNTTGINMTDYVVNSQIQTMWDDIASPTEPADGQGGGLMGVLSQNPPQNLLYTVEVACEPSKIQVGSAPGLLAQMGISSLVDFTAVVQNPEINNAIQDVKNQLIDQISNANLGDSISEEHMKGLENSTKGLQQAISLLKLNDTISYLTDKAFKIEKLNKLVEDLNTPCPSEGRQLASLLPQLEASNVATSNLRAVYAALETRSNKLSLSTLKLELDALKQVTGNEAALNGAVEEPFQTFANQLLASLNKTGTEVFTSLTAGLMPCGNLHNAVKSMIYMGCGPSGLAPRFFAWGLFLALCLLFTVLTFVSLFVLWRVQNHQAKRFADATYKVVH
ncbi:hypothetical protein AAHC03_022723 [Spirometra sp. Aus1]